MAATRHPIDLGELERQLAARAWTKSDLAQHASLSRETVAQVWRSGTATVHVLRAIVAALENFEANEQLARLVRRAS